MLYCPNPQSKQTSTLALTPILTLNFRSPLDEIKDLEEEKVDALRYDGLG